MVKFDDFFGFFAFSGYYGKEMEGLEKIGEDFCARFLCMGRLWESLVEKKFKESLKIPLFWKADSGENSLPDENQQEKRTAQKGREDPDRDFVRENHGSGERIA